jgi:hypothetical protein
LTNLSESSLKDLIGLLKSKDFVSVRKWVGENMDGDQNTIFRKLYDISSQYLKDKPNEAQLVLILAKYQYQSSFVADQEINMMACLTEMMIELEYV